MAAKAAAVEMDDHLQELTGEQFRVDGDDRPAGGFVGISAPVGYSLFTRAQWANIRPILGIRDVRYPCGGLMLDASAWADAVRRLRALRERQREERARVHRGAIVRATWRARDGTGQKRLFTGRARIDGLNKCTMRVILLDDVPGYGPAGNAVSIPCWHEDWDPECGVVCI